VTPSGQGQLRCLFATNHSYLPQRVGGSESTTHELCLALMRRGWHCSVVATSLRPSTWIRLSRVVDRVCGRMAGLSCDTQMGYPVYRVASVIESVHALADAVQPSVVVVQAGAPLPLAEAFAETGIPTILYFHDVEFQKLGGSLNRRPGLSFLANSSFTATKIAQAYGFRPAVLPPLVTPGLYRVQSERRSVVFVNPHPLKGVDIALALARRRPDIPFEFVESWELAAASRRGLLREAARLRNVHWRKWELDMKPVYRLARLILAPSRWEEAWGRVVSEAQVSGIPALASRRGGLPEAVGPGGILVDPDVGVTEWEQALATLWDDSSVYRSLANAAAVHARRVDFQEDAVTSAFVDIAQATMRVS